MQTRRYFYPGYKTMFVYFSGYELDQIESGLKTARSEFGAHQEEAQLTPLAIVGEGRQFMFQHIDLDAFRAWFDSDKRCRNPAEEADAISCLKIPDVILTN